MDSSNREYTSELLDGEEHPDVMIKKVVAEILKLFLLEDDGEIVWYQSQNLGRFFVNVVCVCSSKYKSNAEIDFTKINFLQIRFNRSAHSEYTQKSRDLVNDEMSSNRFQIPYDDIASFVFQNEINDIEDIKTVFGTFREYHIPQAISEMALSTTRHLHINVDKYIEKIQRHVLLACHQKEFILKESLKAKNITENAKTVADEAEVISKKAEVISKKAEEQSERANKTLDGMFANYVTILGIFATIIFAVFGGVNSLASIAGLLGEGRIGISRMVFFASSSLLFLIVILHVLSIWVKDLQLGTVEVKPLKCLYVLLALSIIFSGLWTSPTAKSLISKKIEIKLVKP